MSESKVSTAKDRQYAPDEINEYGEYIKIGGSPTSGLKLRNILRRDTGTFSRIAWSPDGRYLAAPSLRSIYVWDTKDWTATTFNYNSSEIAWSPDSKYFAFGDDGEIRILNIEMGQVVECFITDDGSAIFGLSWSPDGNIIASGGYGNNLILWSVETGQIYRDVEKNSAHIVDVAWSPDGSLLASGDWNNNLTLWKKDTWRPTRQ